MICLIFFNFILLVRQGFLNTLPPTALFLPGFLFLTTAIFKFNPLGYHLFALILRFLSVVLFYKILKEIWPNKPDFAFFAASIFAVYPGFLQQPIALIYCHHFSVLNIFLFSIWLMIKAAKAGKINFFTYGLSVLGSLQMFSIENFATLELIRPFLLWMILDKNGSDKKIP